MPRRMSSVCGREFGNGVRAALERAGLTAAAVSKRFCWDQAKISDLINGKGGSTETEVALVLGACQVPMAEVRHLLALYNESRDKGWLQFPESGVPDQVSTLIEEEKRAATITDWDMSLIPGLLQIPAYARALAEASTAVAASDVDELVEARMARREIFGRGCVFTFYVHEQALWLPVGGPEVLADQLHELLRMSVRTYITLRVVPHAMGGHAGQAGDFRLMTYAKYPPIVYVESLELESVSGGRGIHRGIHDGVGITQSERSQRGRIEGADHQPRCVRSPLDVA